LPQAIVKIEPAADDQMESDDQGTRARQRSSNKNLPAGSQDGNRYRRHFIPTLLKLVAALNEPWVLVDTESVTIMQKTWRKIYGERVEHVFIVNDPVFKNVSRVVWNSVVLCLSINFQIIQRIYEWRSGFGSSAICIINSFFASDVHEGNFDTNEARVTFSELMLDKLRFTYSMADGDDPSVKDYSDSDMLLTFL
jgi:hypothetical protein